MVGKQIQGFHCERGTMNAEDLALQILSEKIDQPNLLHDIFHMLLYIQEVILYHAVPNIGILI